MPPTLPSFLVLALLSPQSGHPIATEDPLGHARHACGSEPSLGALVRMGERLAAGDRAADHDGRPSEHYVIPVTVHVVRRSDGTDGLGPAVIRNSLARANADFAAAGMEFCQYGPTIFIDDDSFHDCVCGTEQTALRNTRRVEDTVNIYFVPTLSAGGQALCGLATYPGDLYSAVVVRNSCAGPQGTALTHELGHFFDLLHTHDTVFGRECADGSDCEFAGDLVCDTPADPNLSGRVNANCVYTGPRTGNCPGDTGILDPATDNYMSYGRGSCLDRFTPGQVRRMRTALILDRPELARPICPPRDFVATPGLVGVSRTPDGAACGGEQPAVAPGGRFVAFLSASPELLPEGVPSNGLPQLFVRDLRTGAIELISLGFDGLPAGGFPDHPALSADGRYVAYSCSARNLAPGVTAIGTNVFRHDRLTGETRLVTPGLNGGGANFFESVPLALSYDGQVIAFESRATNLLDAGTFPFDRIYVADLRAGTLELGSVNAAGEGASNRSYDPAISGDGRVVAFSSSATNLHPQDINSQSDVFVRARGSGKITLASIGEQGEHPLGSARHPSLSADGNRVAFVWAAQGNWPEDRTGVVNGDIVVRDIEGGRLLLASSTEEGHQTAERSDLPVLSADGTLVAFLSTANEFYEFPTPLKDMDVWIKDLVGGDVRLLSPGGGGCDSLGAATRVALDARARLAVFGSIAPNLVAPDGNGVEDVFAFWLGPAVPLATSVGTPRAEPDAR